jgi:hypothetical protein
VDELQRAFEELKAKVKPEMDWLYETRCDRCEGLATTVYTVYSNVFQCPRCLEKVPLFDCADAEGTTATGKPKKIKACPACFARGHVEEISTRSQRFDSLPVLVSYLCEEGCKPQRGKRHHNDHNIIKREFFEKYDLGKINEINDKDIPYWYPKSRMMNTDKNQERWGLLWRPYHGSIATVSDFYTKRNLWASAKLLTEISKFDNLIQDTLLFCLSSILLKSSKMMVHNADNIGRIQKGTLYIPPLIHDVNVWRFYHEGFDDLLAGYSELKINTTNLIISTDDARKIKLPSETIDYIFTDPPYSWKVQYGEQNYIWEAWLTFDTSWLADEIIVNEIRGKQEIDWESAMKSAMKECFRVLKSGRWISLCYHDTSEGTWQLIQDLMTSIGFIPDDVETTIYIDASQKSLKQITASQTTRRDLVINFRKPRPGELTLQLTLFGDEDPSTFTQKARAIIIEALEKHPGSSADRLYDELVSRMVRKGEFERHNFDEILRSVAENVDGRWYLLETADQVDEAESRKETEAAAHLEAFMYQYLQENPGEIGVHYSDLFEQYLPIGDKPRRLMQEWLPEFFFKTEEGTWCPPANNEERLQKEALRTSGTLRRIKRIANALLEGVPPHERDIPDNTATAADWIRQCRRAGLYEQGRALYEKGGLTFYDLGEEAKMEVEEDYQVCARRS